MLAMRYRTYSGTNGWDKLSIHCSPGRMLVIERLHFLFNRRPSGGKRRCRANFSSKLFPFFARGAGKTKQGIPLTCHFSILERKRPQSHFLWLWSGSRWAEKGCHGCSVLTMEGWKRDGPLPLVEQEWEHFYPFPRLRGAGSRPMPAAARIA